MFLADTNGPNGAGGGSWVYPDIDSILQAMTNGQWSILVTNALATNHYTFTVTVSGIDSNILSQPAYSGLSQRQRPHGTNVSTSPTFTWTGPTNFPGTLTVND